MGRGGLGPPIRLYQFGVKSAGPLPLKLELLWVLVLDCHLEVLLRAECGLETRIVPGVCGVIWNRAPPPGLCSTRNDRQLSTCSTVRCSDAKDLIEHMQVTCMHYYMHTPLYAILFKIPMYCRPESQEWTLYVGTLTCTDVRPKAVFNAAYHDL